MAGESLARGPVSGPTAGISDGTSKHAKTSGRRNLDMPSSGAGPLENRTIWGRIEEKIDQGFRFTAVLPGKTPALDASNTPAALDAGGISEEVRELLRQALDEADSVLGIFPASGSGATDDDETQRLVDERTAARANRDFALADELRDKLTEMGIVVEDTPHGAVWHRRN